MAPTSIMLDFEQAAIAAFRNHFPGIEITACLFHLAQSSWRKIQELGMQEQYNNDENFAILCRLPPALAFVPAGDVVQAFRDVAASIPAQYDLNEFLLYFERSYIGTIIAGRQREPIFPPAMWNQYAATVSNLPRTNNSVEGWQNAFRSSVGAHHPTIWRFIDALQKEESLYAFRVAQYATGHPPPQQKKIYQDLDARIVRVVNRFGAVNILAYLRGIAHNIRY